MKLNELSVIYNAAKVHNKMKMSENCFEYDAYKYLSDSVYPYKRTPYIPFIIDDSFALPLHLFSTRLSNLLMSDLNEERHLWEFITARENVIRMITATEMDKSAAEGLSYRFEAYYDAKPYDWKELITFKQVIGYMIKICLELFGYVVAQRRVQVRTLSHTNPKGKDRYFATASRYRRLEEDDLKELLNEIKDPGEADSFRFICKRIISEQTLYQKLYSLDNLTRYNELKAKSV